jgi:hypothetical protein
MHVHMDGKQCRRVALTEKSYCHYHYKHYRHNNITDPGYELPILEDCRSVGLAIEELLRTRIKQKIDDREMTSMMYAMQVMTGLMNKAEAMSPDITEEVLKNQAARTRRGAARAKESETEEDTEGEGLSILRALIDEFGDLLEGNRDDPNWVRPKRSAADYKRLVDNFMEQVPQSREIFSWYPDRFWEEESAAAPATEVEEAG